MIAFHTVAVEGKMIAFRVALVVSALAALRAELSFRPLSDALIVGIALAPSAVAGALLGVLAVRRRALKDQSRFCAEVVTFVGGVAAILFPVLLVVASMAAGLPAGATLPMLLIIGDPVTSSQAYLNLARALGSLWLQGIVVSLVMIRFGVLRREW